MKKVIRLTESDLVRLVKRVISEESTKFGEYAIMVLERNKFKINSEKTTATKENLLVTPYKCEIGSGINIFSLPGKKDLNPNDKCPDDCWVKLDEILKK
jgi:hypothetical protein